MKIYDETVFPKECTDLIIKNGLRKQGDQEACSSLDLRQVISKIIADSESNPNEPLPAVDVKGDGRRRLDDSEKESSDYQGYVVVLCSNKYIGTTKVNHTSGEIISNLEDNYTREELAFVIVLCDCLIMFIFLVTILITEYLIKIDINRHNNRLVECK